MSFLRLDDYTLPGFGLTVAVTQPFPDDDASGNTSSTAQASKGAKAKRLDVRFYLRFSDESALRALARVAEAITNGERSIYTVTNRTANAAGMRQGRFTGDLKAEEQEDRRCWLISFALREHVSVPERAEAREPARPTVAGQNEGQTVAPEATMNQQQELSSAERILQAAEATLGDDGGEA